MEYHQQGRYRCQRWGYLTGCWQLRDGDPVELLCQRHHRRTFCVSNYQLVCQPPRAFTHSGMLTSVSFCSEPGADYRLTFRISVISSYTNGNPWSVVLGGRSITSGAGSSLAWTQIGYTFVCSATRGGNDLTFRIQSNNNRAVRMLVDDVVVTKL